MIAKDIKIKVIFDTNVWIGFLIGKQLAIIEKYIANRQITIVTTDQLLKEIQDVTNKNSLKKYFPYTKVLELIKLLKIIGENYQITSQHSISRAPKER